MQRNDHGPTTGWHIEFFYLPGQVALSDHIRSLRQGSIEKLLSADPEMNRLIEAMNAGPAEQLIIDGDRATGMWPVSNGNQSWYALYGFVYGCQGLVAAVVYTLHQRHAKLTYPFFRRVVRTIRLAKSVAPGIVRA